MQQSSFLSKIISYRFSLLAFLVVALGIVFRLVYFFQNRNLIIDEANVVRNIYERNYLELLQPLKYEQYAPPLYLWAVETMSHIFGYSEYAMRLVALLCGIGALYVFWRLLRKILPENIFWLPLGLLCFAPLVVKYSAEVKQYVPDALVAISLVYFAININLFSISKKRFALYWMLIGSLAVWASQPSVFILASIGLYYFVQIVQEKKWSFLVVLISVGLLWLLQFGIYYQLILKAQINSDYLQNYHHDYFLFLLPVDAAQRHHDWQRIKEIIQNTGGFGYHLYLANIGLMLVGFVALLRKSLSLFCLLACPVLLTLLAAALHQFSLIERVIIFVLPFTMIWIGFGFATILQLKFKVVSILVTLWGIFILSQYNLRTVFFEKLYFHELTAGMDYIMTKGATGKDLYIDAATKDSYIYYTQIHPKKEKYTVLNGAYIFGWSDDNFAEVAAQINSPVAYFIFTSGNPQLREKHINDIQTQLNQTSYYSYFACKVFTFSPKK